jgi:preprotein translocase subunit YajC
LLESTTGGNGGGAWGTILMIGLLFVFLYFFMIRPQKKQEKKDADMRNSLAVGDEVTTIGGIIGKVISIKDETFVLETTREKTQIRFLKGAVRSIDVKVAEVAAMVVENKEAEAAGEKEEK